MTTATPTAIHPHAEMLGAIYADLPRLADHADVDIVLHRADRAPGNEKPVTGKQAVLAHEQALLELTDGTLVMDVEHIVANDHFGAVMGTLRATHPIAIAMPFCGLWRFRAGRIVEHWENAYDPIALQHQLTG